MTEYLVVLTDPKRPPRYEEIGEARDVKDAVRIAREKFGAKYAIARIYKFVA